MTEENKPITEKYLLDNGFEKWGRDDMPVTVNYEKGKLRLAPANAHMKEAVYPEQYGAIWVKDEPDNVFSWRPLIVLKYESDVEKIIKLLEL